MHVERNPGRFLDPVYVKKRHQPSFNEDPGKVSALTGL